MLTSKQRATLRAIANPLETILQLGKSGIGENLIHQVDTALEAREIIKLRALETCPSTAREAADMLAEATGSDVVQTIGTRFVLYRARKKDPTIVL